jgi:DNA-binding transcriptional MerR regulator
MTAPEPEPASSRAPQPNVAGPPAGETSANIRNNGKPTPADRRSPEHPVPGRALRTGEVARLAGVNVQTLRYYERRGLLPAPGRTLGGHRAYPPDTVTLLRTIKDAQRLGFTLDEIATLVAPHRRRPGLRGRAVAKLAEIDARIEELTSVRTALAALIAAGCDDLTNCTSPACPRSSGRRNVSTSHYGALWSTYLAREDQRPAAREGGRRDGGRDALAAGWRVATCRSGSSRSTIWRFVPRRPI